jgi:hypothetical protein
MVKTIQFLAKSIAFSAVFILVCSPVNAYLVTETWQGSVTYSPVIGAGPYYSVGDLVRWSVSYESTSTEMHRYNDGPNGIGELGQGDDSLNTTYSGWSGYSVMSDATFNFGSIFDNLDSERPAENLLYDTSPTSFSSYAVGSEVQQWYQVDHLQFYMRNAAAGFHLFAEDSSNDRVYSHYVNLENLTLVPIPAALPLLGSALGLLGLLGWRNRKRA